MKTIKIFMIFFSFLSAIVVAQNYGSSSGMYGFGSQPGFGGNPGGNANANIWNAATMAFRAVLTLPNVITKSFLKNLNTQQALQSLPNMQSNQNALQSLIQSFGISNQQTLQKYIDALMDPKLSKTQLNAIMTQLGQESTMFGDQINAANTREMNDWTRFQTKVRTYTDLTPLVANITAIRNNVNIGLGDEVLQLVDNLISLTGQLQYELCQIVDDLTRGQPQFTARGLASLATTCQTIETLYSSQGSLGGFIGNQGIGDLFGGLGGYGNGLGGYGTGQYGSGYPYSGYPSSGYPSSSYPYSGYPSSGYPYSGYPSSGYPSSSYPYSGYPSSGYPSSGYPYSGYPSGYPSSGYPYSGYPSSSYPYSGYPSSGYPYSGSGYPYNTNGGYYGNQLPYTSGLGGMSSGYPFSSTGGLSDLFGNQSGYPFGSTSGLGGLTGGQSGYPFGSSGFGSSYPYNSYPYSGISDLGSLTGGSYPFSSGSAGIPGQGSYYSPTSGIGSLSGRFNNPSGISSYMTSQNQGK